MVWTLTKRISASVHSVRSCSTDLSGLSQTTFPANFNFGHVWSRLVTFGHLSLASAPTSRGCNQGRLLQANLNLGNIKSSLVISGNLLTPAPLPPPASGLQPPVCSSPARAPKAGAKRCRKVQKGAKKCRSITSAANRLTYL